MVDDEARIKDTIRTTSLLELLREELRVQYFKIQSQINCFPGAPPMAKGLDYMTSTLHGRCCDKTKMKQFLTFFIRNRFKMLDPKV